MRAAGGRPRSIEPSVAGTTSNGTEERCTSLRTTEPSSAPLIGFSPTVPTTMVPASISLATAMSTSAGLPSSMRVVVEIPAASRSLTARAMARVPTFSSWLLKSVDSPSNAGPPKALMW